VTSSSGGRDDTLRLNEGGAVRVGSVGSAVINYLQFKHIHDIPILGKWHTWIHSYVGCFGKFVNLGLGVSP